MVAKFASAHINGFKSGEQRARLHMENGRAGSIWRTGGGRGEAASRYRAGRSQRQMSGAQIGTKYYQTRCDNKKEHGSYRLHHVVRLRG
jgi:hypothetical protein